MTTDPDPAEGEVPTLRDRMRAAGLSDERIAVHADANAIALDGELVRDLDRPAPPGTRWHSGSGRRSARPRRREAVALARGSDLLVYDRKVHLHRCDRCHRAMNPTDSLTEMNKPGAGSIGICPSGGCWKKANAEGYMSRHQASGAVALADGSHHSPPSRDDST